jgi:hypothetical protein
MDAMTDLLVLLLFLSGLYTLLGLLTLLVERMPRLLPRRRIRRMIRRLAGGRRRLRPSVPAARWPFPAASSRA